MYFSGSKRCVLMATVRDRVHSPHCEEDHGPSRCRRRRRRRRRPTFLLLLLLLSSSFAIQVGSDTTAELLTASQLTLLLAFYITLPFGIRLFD